MFSSFMLSKCFISTKDVLHKFTYSQPSISKGSASADLTNQGLKYSESKKNPESSKNWNLTLQHNGNYFS